jgi:hypothetical protein
MIAPDERGGKGLSRGFQGLSGALACFTERFGNGRVRSSRN